jgi:hypothetical protein
MANYADQLDILGVFADQIIDAATTTPEDRDAIAEQLLDRVVRPLAYAMRAYGPDEVVTRWRQLTRADQEAAVTLFAAGFPVHASTAEAFGWRNPGRVVPEHADEWAWDAPPLRIGVHA